MIGIQPGLPARLGGVAGAVALALPSDAQAHAFADRFDLPLPLGFYLAGAALAVALSFLGSFLIRRPLGPDALCLEIPVPAVLAGPVSSALQAGAVVLLLIVLAAGIVGPESPTRNLATVFVWVLWWVGLVLFSALVTDLWTPANPFRTLVEASLRAVGSQGDRSLPAVAGWLPVVGILALSWLELVSDWSEVPVAVTALAGSYFLFLFIGSAVFGSRSWLETADPLTRLFGLLGRMAPVAAIQGRVRLRVPAAGLFAVEAGVPGAVFAVSLIAVVLFDGLSETPAWAGLLDAIARSQTIRPWLLELRGAGIDILKLLRSLGLFATVAAAVVLYGLLTMAMWRAACCRISFGRVFSGFAASLLPIAVAYHLAHYVSYLALAGQLAIPLASDPFGLGWDLFGVAGHRIDLGVIAAGDVWWIAAVSLVVGHGLSVLVAHAQALRLFPDRPSAIRSQLPMMVFMVGLTAFSLWILAQPIVA